MAVCLEYQSVYCRRDKIVISVRMQVIAGVLLLLALVGKVWIKIETTDLGYQLSREREVKNSLEMEKREYELQRSVLLRTDNLTRIAQRKLGLQQLDPTQARRMLLVNQ
jgi:cell division protein FtsL